LGRLEEKHPDFGTNRFIVSRRHEEGDERGTILYDKSRNIEVLLPDKERTAAKPGWRRLPAQEWNNLGEMRKAK
jgi:hypothetical protein